MSGTKRGHVGSGVLTFNVEDNVHELIKFFEDNSEQIEETDWTKVNEARSIADSRLWKRSQNPESDLRFLKIH